MQEILIKTIIGLSIIVNILLSLRYVSSKLINYYKEKKKYRETRLKRQIHNIVHSYLESIANSK